MCKHISLLDICYQRVLGPKLPQIIEFISAVLSSCNPQSMEFVRLTFQRSSPPRDGGTDWMEVPDHPFFVGRFTNLQAIHVLFNPMATLDLSLFESWKEELLPSVPREKKEISVAYNLA